MGEPYLWRTANMSPRTCVVVKQMQSNPIDDFYFCIHAQDQIWKKYQDRATEDPGDRGSCNIAIA